MEKAIKYIVCTGVESSGKSTLCKALASQFNEPYVAEMARTILENEKGTYQYEDIERIARAHWRVIEEKSKQANAFLFIDTAFLVHKIWSEEKFGQCSRFILDKLNDVEVAAYFLLDPNIPYEEDVLRETPNKKDRDRLFKIYQYHLSEMSTPHFIITGTKKEQLNQAAHYIQNIYFDL